MSALGKLVVSLALEYAAYTKGLDKADQDALRFAQNAQRHFGQAKQASTEFLTGIVKGAAGAVAAVFTVDAAMSKFNQSLDVLAKLDDMAQKTGAAVENLSKMQKVASAFGTDFSGVDGALIKLAKGMATVDSETNKTNKALDALGVKSKDAAGKLRDPSEVMIEVSKRLQDYEDGANKAALVTDLFGKSGAELLPYLNDLAENVDKFGGASAEAAKQAADFQDKLGVMKTRVDELFTSVSVSLLPTLTDFVDALGDTKKNADALTGQDSLTSWVDDLAVGLARVVDVAKLVPQAIRAVGGSFEAVGADIELLNYLKSNANPIAAGAKLLQGRNPNEEMQAALDKRNKIVEDANKRLADLWNQPANLTEQAMLDRIAKRGYAGVDPFLYGGGETGGGKSRLGYQSGKDSVGTGAKEAISNYEKLTLTVEQHIAMVQKQIDIGRELTATEKALIALDLDLAAGKLKLTPLQEEAYRALLKQKGAVDDLFSSQQAMKKLGDELVNQGAKSVKALEDELEKQKEQIGLIGLSKREIDELAAKKLDLAAATDEESAANLRAAAVYAGDLHDYYLLYAQDLEKAAKLKRELASGKREAVDKSFAVQEAERASAAWKKSSEQISDWLGDAFARGFGKGNDLFKSLLNSIKVAAARLVINPIIQPIAAVGASFLNPNAAQAVGSVPGSLGQAGNIFSAGKALWDGFNSGFSATGGQVAQYVQSGINYVTGSGGMVSQGPIQLGSFAQGVGTAAGYLGGASIGVYGGRALSNGYAISGSGNGVVNAGTAIGAVLGGPIGAAIGGLIGGAANRLFGMRPKEYTTAGIQGNFNQEGFTDGQNFQRWEQKGGVFRSNKDGTDYTALDALYSKALGDGFKALKTTTSDFAQSLGLNAGLIAGYAKGMVIDLTGDQVKDAEILAKTFGEMGDEMATILLPNFKEFQKTGESASATLGRLASVNQTVDGVLGAIGIDAVAAFNDVGVAAANAKQRLVDVAGGMDAFLAKSNFFVSNFLSEAEQLKPASDRIAAVFARHNIAGDISKDDFAARVKKALLDTSDAGKAMANELLDIAPLFLQVASFAEKSATVLDKAVDTVADTADDVADTAAIAAERIRTALDGVATAYAVLQRSVEAERDFVTKAYEKAIAPITKSIEKLKGLSQALHSALDGRRIEAQFGSDRAAAQAQIATALSIARAGGLFPDADTLSRALNLVSQPSEQLFATFEDYQRDFLRTSNDIENLAALTDDQLSIDERRLKAEEEGYKAEMARLDGILSAAQAEVDAINGVNTSVLTVAAAIAGLNGAIVGAKAVGANPAAGPGSGANSAVASLYERFSDSSYMTAEGAAYWAARVNSGESTASIEQSFQDSVKAVRGFAVGTNYVPDTGMAIIHEGERIIPAADNRELMARLQSPTANDAALVAEIRALRSEVKTLREEQKAGTMAIAQNTSRAARQLERWDGDGLPAERDLTV